MSRSAFRTLLSLSIASVFAVAFSSQAAAAGPMNVVLLVADDLGWADTSLLRALTGFAPQNDSMQLI